MENFLVQIETPQKAIAIKQILNAFDVKFESHTSRFSNGILKLLKKSTQ